MESQKGFDKTNIKQKMNKIEDKESQTTTAGLKDIISKDKSRDLFKDCTR